MKANLKTTKLLLKDLRKNDNKLQSLNFISQRDPIYQSI